MSGLPPLVAALLMRELPEDERNVAIWAGAQAGTIIDLRTVEIRSIYRRQLEGADGHLQ